MNQEISSLPLHAPSSAVEQPQSAALTVNWPHVAWFLGLAFGLTWLLDLVLYLNGGLANPAAKLFLQFQMLLPAFSALLLGVFFFKESPVYFRTNQTASRWFIYFYFALTALYLGGAIYGQFQPAQAAVIGSLLLIPSIVGLILVIALRLVGKKNAFAGAGMAGGRARIWLLYGIGVILFYGLQSLLNYVFKLGTIADIRALFPPGAADAISPVTLILSTALNAIVIGPFLGLIITFGEEYGWRGYLQPELTRLGRKRGVLLLGIIWGIWHWPVIWMGYNYPGQPIIGSLMMVAYCVGLAYFLAYAVFKSKGVWTAAYLHALNNQVLSFFMGILITPKDMMWSFGVGVPSVVALALAVFLILRDPIWNER